MKAVPTVCEEYVRNTEGRQLKTLNTVTVGRAEIKVRPREGSVHYSDNGNGVKSDGEYAVAYKAVEQYLMGTKGPDSRDYPETQLMVVEELRDGVFIWKPLEMVQPCQLHVPKKIAKLGGLRSVLAYELKSSLSDVSVHRKFNNFQWLYRFFKTKYPGILVPPLPPETRGLLPNGEGWRLGKVRVEKDPFVNFFSFLGISAQAETSVSLEAVDNEMDGFMKFTRSLRSDLEALRDCAERQAVKSERKVSADMNRMGQAFMRLSDTLGPKEVDEEVRVKLQFLEHMIQRCSHILPDQFLKAQSTYRAYLQGMNCLTPSIVVRSNKISFCLMAEMTRFRQELATDLRRAMTTFLDEQIQMHRKIIEELERGLEQYNAVQGQAPIAYIDQPSTSESVIG
ncbi:unnamed protein product [Cyprideis torosa]|uniref:Uncharacterized protein n=1 Tax=Cyprideis torosa TaxID=163714 RepID=A0A7R8ZMY3_9CRUS|nr:unnamed protein product [Cyprideis torosa]CAG0894990.1 unnamed protein product [Cyprideis torosa]